MTSASEDGLKTSKILILGEAPSHEEVRRNKPFVGPSGQVLDICLHSAGLLRRECYFLNVFDKKVRKRNTSKGEQITDDFGDLLFDPRTGFTELGEEFSANFLSKISQSDANVVIPLGATATNVLLGDSRITKLRGSMYWSDLIDKKVIPTLHPAASLRGQYIYRHFITSDLRRAAREAEFPDLRLPQRTIHHSPSFSEAVDFLREVRKARDVTGADIEIYNHQVYCYGFSLTPNEIMSVPFVDDVGQPWWSEEEEIAIWLAISDLLADDQVRKVYQNGIFDISFVAQRNKVLTLPPYEDIMIAHHIIWPDFPKGLDFQASMHTDEPYYKDEGKQWNKIEDPEAFRAYNAKDCAVTHEIWNELEPVLMKEDYYQTYRETMDMFPVFLTMMLRGVKVDAKALKEAQVEIAAEIKGKLNELEEIADYPFNVGSPKQCQEYFYIHKGIKPYMSRSTGRPTTDDKAMSRIFRKHGLREAKLVQEIRALKKLSGTYLDVGVSSDGRIRCTYNLRGTVTGRPSSSRTITGEGMNMQNLHPKFKRFLVADND